MTQLQYSKRTLPKLTQPKLGAWLLTKLMSEEDNEAVLGDIEEEYQEYFAELGSLVAARHYWMEVIRSIPSLLVLLIKNKLRRSRVMGREISSPRLNKFAVIGLVVIIPAFLLVFSGVLQTAFGVAQVSDIFDKFDLQHTLFHPLVIMGGLFAAFVLNTIPVVRIQFQTEEDNLVGVVKLKRRFLNIGVSLISAFLICCIMLYVFVENWVIVAR